jgi:hypothetical protein
MGMTSRLPQNLQRQAKSWLGGIRGGSPRYRIGADPENMVNGAATPRAGPGWD